MSDRQAIFWAVLLLVIAAGLAAWWLKPPAPPAPAAEPPPPAAESPPPAGPRFPLPEDDGEPRPALEPLPALDDSDEYFRMELAELFGGEAVAIAVSDALIERLVATIDNLPRQRVAERVRPVESLATPFVAASGETSGEYVLGEDNYRRYDTLVDQFVAADLDRLVELYRRYYPLFQKAYVGLGYPQGYFNDRLVEVIDHLLQTPEIDAPLSLVRPHVLYQFSDPQLEALSGGQKLLLRMGPANRARVLEKLDAFRARVAAGADTR